jgi:hypothetical protein
VPRPAQHAGPPGPRQPAPAGPAALRTASTGTARPGDPAAMTQPPMDTSGERIAAALSRMQERNWLRSRPGGRSQLVLSARLGGAGPGACSLRNAGASAVSMWMSGVGVAAGFQMSCARARSSSRRCWSAIARSRRRGRSAWTSLGRRLSAVAWAPAAGLEHASGGDLVVSALDPARTGPASGAGSLERRRVAHAVAKLRPCAYKPEQEPETMRSR